MVLFNAAKRRSNLLLASMLRLAARHVWMRNVLLHAVWDQCACMCVCVCEHLCLHSFPGTVSVPFPGEGSGALCNAPHPAAANGRSAILCTLDLIVHSCTLSINCAMIPLHCRVLCSPLLASAHRTYLPVLTSNSFHPHPPPPTCSCQERGQCIQCSPWLCTGVHSIL